jgi:hypothetical protein
LDFINQETANPTLQGMLADVEGTPRWFFYVFFPTEKHSEDQTRKTNQVENTGL